MNHEPKLIIALDKLSREKAEEIISSITKNCADLIERIVFKVNDLLDRVGLEWISEIAKKYNIKMMLDMKDIDIPDTMANSFSQVIDTGLWETTEYITIMADAGLSGMKAVVDARNIAREKNPSHSPKILAVSVLTSMDDKECRKKFGMTINEKMLLDLREIRSAGLDGMICSLRDAQMIREVLWDEWKDFLLVTPWVRFSDTNSTLGQKRVSTPWVAMQYESDVVMGTDILSNAYKDNETWLDKKFQKNPEETEKAIRRVFAEFDSTTKKTEESKFQLEKYLYERKWFEVLKYIGAIYDRPQNETGIYCRWTSGIIAQTYTNIAVLERNYKIVKAATREMTEKIESQWIEADIVMWAQMGSIRLSLALAESLGIEESVYTEKSWEREMSLNRHEIDLKWRKVILSEDMITKGSTIEKMKHLVESQGGTVVGIACVGNLSWKEDYQWIPFIYLFKPVKRDFFYDEETLATNRKNMIAQWKSEDEIIQAEQKIKRENSFIPTASIISPKPKNDWGKLVQSMRG
jgi:orotidine-5'-phosphate decarboxylase